MPQTAGYPKTLTKRVAKSILEEVSDAKQKLSVGQTYRRSKREEAWKKAERQYEGNHWSGSDGGQDEIVVNLSFSTHNTIVPYITGSEPSFLVSPHSQEATSTNAMLQQNFLNRLWKDPNVQGQEELTTSAEDYLMYGDGYVKVGYSIEEMRTSENSYDEVGSVWVQSVSPWDIWVDPSADGLHNARWVAQRIRMTKTELQDSDNFYNTHDENVTYGTEHAVASGGDDEKDRFRQEVFDGSEYATLYEFYDMVNKVKITFDVNGELPLQYVEDIGALPIVALPNYRIPRSPYHMGEMEQLWSLQQELNKSRSQMIQHRRRNVQKYAYRKDALTETALAALKSDTVNEAIELLGDQPIENVLKPLSVPPLSADVYNVSEIVSSDIYEISGVNEYLRGSVPEIRRTATEATIIEGASNVKSQHKLRTIEKAAAKIGYLMLQFAADIFPETNYDEMKLYVTGKEAARIANAIGQPERAGEDLAIKPHPDLWVGRYTVEVERASTELRNPVMRAEKWRAMFIDLMSAAPQLAEMGVRINPRHLLEMWFEAAGVDDIDSMFIDEPPQPQQIAAQGTENPEGTAAGGGADLGVSDIPPDALMGAFTEENTGILPAVEGGAAY